MQIVQYIPHPRYKITIFKSGPRYIVKFDDADHDLSIKYREGEVDGLPDLVSKINDDLLKEIDHIFGRLAKYRAANFRQSASRYPDII